MAARACVCMHCVISPFERTKKNSTEHEHILCLVRNVLLLLLPLPLLLLFSLTNLNKNSRCFNSSLYTSTERNETIAPVIFVFVLLHELFMQTIAFILDTCLLYSFFWSIALFSSVTFFLCLSCCARSDIHTYMLGCLYVCLSLIIRLTVILKMCVVFCSYERIMIGLNK